MMANLKTTKSLRRTLLIVWAVLISLLIPTWSIAQTPSPFYWDFIHVDIAVQNNGDMLVTETQKYVFTQDHPNQRYRYIPLDKIDEITDVAVSEDEVPLTVQTGIRDGKLWVEWAHDLGTLQPHRPEVHTFVLHYRVVGGIHVNLADSEMDQVYWRAIFPDRSAPIQSAKVTIYLPDALKGKVSKSMSLGIPTQLRPLDSQAFEFVAQQPIPPQHYIEVQVQFPHQLLDLTVPQWQQHTPQPSQKQRPQHLPNKAS